MNFIEGGFYHIYNRGNNKQRIFFQERNYEYFIIKIRKYIVPNANLIAWCLMPNHFHFLVQANSNSVSVVREKPVVIRALSEGIRLLLSSYAQGIQRQEGNVGSLFQQKTKSKLVNGYLYVAFQYIHQNPVKAGLIEKLEDYKWSSFAEYGISSESFGLCNKEVFYQHVDVDHDKVLKNSYESIQDELIRMIED